MLYLGLVSYFCPFTGPRCFPNHGGTKQKFVELHPLPLSIAGQLLEQLDPLGLLRDLKQRGLLDETLILCTGEFGRTPSVEMDQGGGGAAHGRDHNHWGFSLWMAGGGIKGGTTFGATDEFGFKAVENPVSIHDLHATMLHLLGFDHEKLTYRYAGRDFRLTDVFGKVVREVIS